MQNIWTKVDDYFAGLLAPSDPALDSALGANRRAGLPEIDVSPLQGKFLELIVLMSGAKRILEIGTLGGYSTIWFARAVGANGHVTTLEMNPHHAAVARGNLNAAGVLDRVEVITGPAITSLPLLEGKIFDLVFIDADKRSNPDYLSWALRLTRLGSVIICDNVVRGGQVTEPDTGDADVEGVRRFTEMVAAEPRLSATVIQTIGAKGYDGFALAVVTAPGGK
jgi:predicted O-methyltransferase YrrM